MKLRELKSVIPIVQYVILENQDKMELMHGYSEWLLADELDNMDVVTMYAVNDTLHIMIKHERRENEFRYV